MIRGEISPGLLILLAPLAEHQLRLIDTCSDEVTTRAFVVYVFSFTVQRTTRTNCTSEDAPHQAPHHARMRTLQWP